MRRHVLAGILALSLPALAVVAAPAPARASATSPAVSHLTLGNGLPVHVASRRRLPIVSVQVVLRNGALYEPQDHPGVASAVASLLTRGTSKRSATQIAEAIEFVGGSLSASADGDKTIVTLSVLKKDLDLGLDLLTDVLLHPTFAADEVSRHRNQLSAGLLRSLDDPNEEAGLLYSKELFPGSPYGRPVSGTLSSIKGLTPEVLRTYYDTTYHPDRAFVVVVGDLSADEARDRLQKALGTWGGHAAPLPSTHGAPATAGREVDLLDADVNQSYVAIGNVALPIADPDTYPLRVADYILGGGFESRLFKEVRDKRGLAYSAYAHPMYYSNTGANSVNVETKLASTQEALQVIMDELRKITTKKVTPQELAIAKGFYKGYFPLRFEGNGDLAGQITSQQFYGLGEDYFAKYAARIDAVTADDVLRVAKKYLSPDHYHLTIVTKADQEQAVLAPFGTIVPVPAKSLID